MAIGKSGALVDPDSTDPRVRQFFNRQPDASRQKASA